MKTMIQYIFIAVLSIFTFNLQELQAKPPKPETLLSEKLQSKVNEKVTDLTKKMTKELNLSTKQTKKVHAIKLSEAFGIEVERNNNAKSQQDIKNEIILILNQADKQIYKVLKKDQDVLYESKKSDYRYNPGLMEKLKDIYKDTKEIIKEKMGIH